MARDSKNLGTTSESTIRSLLWNAWGAQAETAWNMRIRRMLVSRDRTAIQTNGTGTILPPPFDQSNVAIRNMIGEMSKAVHIAASRLADNPPDIQVIPLTSSSDISQRVEKTAGMQERLDSEIWHEAGGPDCQWEAAWAKCVTGAAFWLTLPRDADFGLPSRTYYDDISDDEIEMLKNSGKAVPREAQDGKLIYAEHGDVWAARRKMYMQNRAANGRSLFSMTVYPRDMVLKERDREANDLKWAAIVEEIPATECAPGSDFALNIAKAKGLTPEMANYFGVFWDTDQKRIIGGIPKGGPLNSAPASYESFTLIRWFDREDQVILIAPRASVQDATEIWRGKHGCTVQGVPACPVVEDAFYRTDINVIGKEYSTALDAVFAYVPQINQLMTLLSNVAVYNGLPRLVGELQNGSTLRGDSGEPNAVDSAPVPGLDPSEIAFYPGKVTQLTISADTLLATLKIYFERLAEVMPQLGAAASGADAAGWAIMQRVQEAQQPYIQPSKNFCQAAAGIVKRWHGWMRMLDVPIYFFAAPGNRGNKREIRGLIEFEPKDLVDSIRVEQDIYTPAEATVRTQIAMEKWQAQLIDDEEFYEITGEQDAREAVVRRWIQIVTNYVMTGALPPPPPGGQPGPAPLVQIVADGVRGAVHYEMIQQSGNYAIAVAENMVQQANQQQQMQMMAQGAGAPAEPNGMMARAMPQGQGNAAYETGTVMPGMGMAGSLQQQLGPRAPQPAGMVGA